MNFTPIKPVASVAVLGAGSAGLLAAITLRRRCPWLPVRVVRSAEIGTIGVGEGTTQLMPRYLFEQLGLKPAQFYAEAEPTWKLGIRFQWGPRRHFHYTFSKMIDVRWGDLPRNNGFYAEHDFDSMDLWSGLMEQDNAFARGADGKPDLKGHSAVAFHIENRKLVAYLDARAIECGVEFIDGTVAQVERAGEGVGALVLEDGSRVEADLYIDASGFRSELLQRALGGTFVPYTKTLFCERAVIGGWHRTTEKIRPYTTVETMDAGWAWQIEHETFINRGYVYSSAFLSDDAAREEFLRKNPQVTTEPRIVKFRTGRMEKMWMGNVVGIGNASGFVEPLEASSLQMIILQCRTLVDILIESSGAPTPGMQRVYNMFLGDTWDRVRDFLAVHYRFNTRLDTAFWQACRADCDLGNAAGVVDYYQENGPTPLARSLLLHGQDPYGFEGYFALLVGQQVPHARPHAATAKEKQAWAAHRNRNISEARGGFTVAEALAAVREPDWKW